MTTWRRRALAAVAFAVLLGACSSDDTPGATPAADGAGEVVDGEGAGGDAPGGTPGEVDDIDGDAGAAAGDLGGFASCMEATLSSSSVLITPLLSSTPGVTRLDLQDAERAVDELLQKSPEALHEDLEVIDQGLEVFVAAWPPDTGIEEVADLDNVQAILESGAFQQALANLTAWVESVCE